ncbi:amidohydrolase family protein [Dinghuibacter silviterrae]|uniref:Cytosine/adenosine deaminase-related metal-dependent hydrolase n=1 Tax=Dinghuibacter silviterrae TaxID=1539049 RepID=A0A4R8DQR8_9BACT|nr:amidohydrolase family protein [Dinghuibacter silviterrae]TDW99470.1 cytosine/adenosine deaminase-related metal-dependent hydrolase [Dinghuibacter silviterrae]
MGYWKIQADGLFDGEQIQTGLVLVGTGDGEITALVPLEEAGEDVQRLPGILSPGFVNTHCHLELSHMAGVIPEGTGMVDFLLQVMGRRGDGALDPLEAARQADRRMYDEGIVAVGDISNNISTLPLKAGSSLYYHTFVEVMGFLPASADARLAQARQVYDAAVRVMGPGTASLVPHAPYSVSKPLFEAINRTCAGSRAPLSIHNQESEPENEFYRTATGDFLRLYAALGQNLDFFTPYGKDSLETYLPWLDTPSNILLVHNVTSHAAGVRQAQHLAASRHQSLFWCLCPGANQYIQRAMPPVDVLRQAGCTLTLGTDSLASNHQLSILHEMRLLQEHVPGLSLEELLRWATVNGARALGIDHLYGRFAPGTRPGVLLLDALEGQRITAGAKVVRLRS